MTQLAETLKNIIHDSEYIIPLPDEWLEEKAKEVRAMVYREIRQDIRIDLMILAKEMDGITNADVAEVIIDKLMMNYD